VRAGVRVMRACWRLRCGHACDLAVRRHPQLHAHLAADVEQPAAVLLRLLQLARVLAVVREEEERLLRLAAHLLQLAQLEHLAEVARRLC